MIVEYIIAAQLVKAAEGCGIHCSLIITTNGSPRLWDPFIWIAVYLFVLFCLWFVVGWHLYHLLKRLLLRMQQVEFVSVFEHELNVVNFNRRKLTANLVNKLLLHFHICQFQNEASIRKCHFKRIGIQPSTGLIINHNLIITVIIILKTLRHASRITLFNAPPLVYNVVFFAAFSQLEANMWWFVSHLSKCMIPGLFNCKMQFNFDNLMNLDFRWHHIWW